LPRTPAQRQGINGIEKVEYFATLRDASTQLLEVFSVPSFSTHSPDFLIYPANDWRLAVSPKLEDGLQLSPLSKEGKTSLERPWFIETGKRSVEMETAFVGLCLRLIFC
jgi:hypothetical protein